ncbi:MAG: D-alanyl-D-alanine carboxypeptidase family protein [Devosiaceae bacterium]
MLVLSKITSQKMRAGQWLVTLIAIVFGCLIATFSAIGYANAQAFESRAPRAYLFDVNSRTVLYAQREDERFEPASMAKVLTAAVVFDQLENGTLRSDSMFPISEDAWRRGGGPSGRAAMFAELNSAVAVEDLLRGLIIMAGNDAAIALAEGVARNERAFATLMSERAEDLGARDSVFTNATGEPEAGMHTTVRDLVVVASALMNEHPQLYSIFGEPEFTWNDIFQRHRNPIYSEIAGADGLMAGFSDDAGYGVVGSVERDGRRIVFALSGVDTAEGRVDEARRLVRYAFEDFRTVRVAEPGEPIAFARTHGGSVREVGLIAEDGVALELLLPQEGVDRVRARVAYDSPLAVPIAAGTQVGRLLVERDGTIIQETPLVAATDVTEGSLVQRARDGFLELVIGWIPPISFAGTF